MRGTSVLAACLMLLAGGAVARAQENPAYSAQSVLDHFLAASAAKDSATRALCIGDCPGGVPAPAKPDAFNLEVTFELGSDRLSAPARRNLDEFAKALLDPRLSGLRLSVDGHTDAKGPDSLNDSLSRRRAQSVVQYLETKGVKSSLLQTRGFGKRKPKTEDPFDPANRRVEAQTLN
jgi:outer membrane protein OmpA-like peptidoglycan-associated protein